MARKRELEGGWVGGRERRGRGRWEPRGRGNREESPVRFHPAAEAQRQRNRDKEHIGLFGLAVKAATWPTVPTSRRVAHFGFCAIIRTHHGSRSSPLREGARGTSSRVFCIAVVCPSIRRSDCLCPASRRPPPTVRLSQLPGPSRVLEESATDASVRPL